MGAVRIEVSEGRPAYKDTADRTLISGQGDCRHIVNRSVSGMLTLESADGHVLWSQPELSPPGLTLEKDAAGLASLRANGLLLWKGHLAPSLAERRPEKLPSLDPETSITRADGIRFTVGHGQAMVRDDTQGVLWAGPRPDPPRLDIRADGHVYRMGPSDLFVQKDWAEDLALTVEAGTVRMQDEQGKEIATEPVFLTRLKVKSPPSSKAYEEIGIPETTLTAYGVVLLTFFGANGKPVHYQRITHLLERRPGEGGYTEAHRDLTENWDADAPLASTTDGSWATWRPDVPTPVVPEGEH